MPSETLQCSCCEMEFTLKWRALDIDDEDDDVGIPLFCPFCGNELNEESEEE